MNYYEKIMAQHPCGENIEERVRGFIKALKAGDVKALAKYDFGWVAINCFTYAAEEAYEATRASALVDYWRATDPEKEKTFRKALDTAWKAFRKAHEAAKDKTAATYDEATAPSSARKASRKAIATAEDAYRVAKATVFLTLAQKEENWK